MEALLALIFFLLLGVVELFRIFRPAELLRHFLLGVFALLPVLLHGQNNNDSLLRVFENAPKIESRIEAGLNLTKSMLFRKPDSARHFAGEVLKLAKSANSKKDQATAWKFIGITYSIVSSYDTAEVCYRQALSLSKEIGDKLEMAFALNNLGMNAMQAERFDTAITYFYAALRLKEELSDSIEAVKLDFGSTLQNIGIVFHSMQNFDQAEHFYKRAYIKYAQVKNYAKLHVLQMEIAGLNSERGDLISAIQDYKRIAKLIEADGNIVALAKLYNNLGMALKEAGQTEESVYYLELSLGLNEQTGDELSLAITYSNLAQLYFEKNQIDQAYDYAFKGYNLCKSIGRLRTAMETAALLAEILYDRGNYKEAVVYERSVRELSDSLFKESINQFMIESEARYQNEKSRGEIDRLNAERLLQNELIGQKNREKNIWLGVTLLLAVLLFLLFRLYRRIRAQRILLSAQNVKLEELSATKSKLFAVISHDLRNPMYAFRSITQSLSNNSATISVSDLSYYLKELDDSSEKMLVLLQNLLQWAKVQTGALKIMLDEVDIKQVVEETISLQQAQAQLKQIELHNEVPDACIQLADKLILQTVLRNLLSNAVKFTPQGGHVKFKYFENTTGWQLIVADTGIGMTKDELDRLFSTDTLIKQGTMQSEKGSGLGLLICKEMLSLCSAHLSAESDFGKGSRFIMDYPKGNSHE